MLGLALLGLVLAGMAWSRAALDEPPAGIAAATVAPADITAVDRSVIVGDVRLTVSLPGRPARALSRFRLRVRAERHGMPVALEGGRVSFQMAMPMGVHRATLAASSGGWHEAEIALPTCLSGDGRWQATVDGYVSGRHVAAVYELDLNPAE